MIKVLITASEVFPFAKVGGLADVAGSLPKALVSMGCDVRVIMPMYGSIDREKYGISKEAGNIRHPLFGKPFEFDLYSCKTGGVIFYFINKDEYFARQGIYGTEKRDYPDNARRFAFLSKAALVVAKSVGFKPDVIHCNDWQTALVPLYLKFILKDDDFYMDIKVLFTIHNMAYQGIFRKRELRSIGVPFDFFKRDSIEFYGKINFMKSGLIYSDAVSTVSKKYAEEILTPEYGCGLDGLLRARKDPVFGILNGVDYSVWNPENDGKIKVNYSADTLEKKAECKKDLLEYTKLSVSPQAPLIGSVTRLVEQKGMDLVAKIMDRVVAAGAGVVILGIGGKKYNRLFSRLTRKFPGKVYVCNEFNAKLAHKIEGGCDIFLMPSRYEPCGLNQMYSLKYGTIPVVRATGGLDDAIVDFDEDRDKGNGFKFDEADKESLFEAVRRAIARYKDRALWQNLMVKAMSYDYSWEHSAKEYCRLYKKILEV